MAEAKKRRRLATHTITIYPNIERGDLSYSDPSLRAGRKETICWQVDPNVPNAGPFAVQFGASYPTEKRKAGGCRAIRLKVRDYAEYGVYKYFVAVTVGNDMLTDDPEVIIDY